ncbi:glycosyltransferase [Roseospira visakhapatnamensis]|uniref:Glycosyltransferase involved in cell wall biosynthesis n=1 Tax=Roseospira visakhapatnamensis TaxID=390880 RepID=A0A7W6W9V5_9PROT|nr:glycosyltransferase [Roseospira visakhapatnamensis]MBB4266344.1 glycosyltransferase involved in cell wall biosynthesis [Roseospira visakhapatnamensis]
MRDGPVPAPVAVVLKGYPRLSETFIARELLGLEERGLSLRLFSLRQPYDAKTHPVHARISAPVTYLPEYLHREPLRVLRAWARARRLPGYRAARAIWLRDLWRDRTRNRLRRWGQALVLAAEMPADVAWIYVHFLHTPGSVGRYAARLTGRPFSLSAHARDIWTSPAWEKAEKLADARWTVTCTEAAARHLDGLAPGRVTLLYHGLDLDTFPPPPAPVDDDRDGTDPTRPVRLLAVGRAVPKKGFDRLLRALAALPDDVRWTLTHIGGGAEARALKALAESLGLADRITWHGAQAQTAVIEAYRAADLFVLPCIVAGDGDRDGLPNVLMEAQSQGLACLSTDLSGIPELIVDGETGVLVPPDDVPALTAALAGLIADPATRRRLGAAGQARVRTRFDNRAELTRLAGLFHRDLAGVGGAG